MNSKLWYRRPASDWLEGIPVGNGRIASMVLGQYPRERLALNHEWLWTGKNRYRDVETKAQYLPEIRKLLMSGKYEEGTELANYALAGNGGISGKPNRVDKFQTAGDLWIEIPHGPVFDYHREINLETATAITTYKTNYDKKYTRTCIAHFEEDLLIVHLISEGENFNAAVSLSRSFSSDCKLSFETTGNSIIMRGDIEDGIDFCVRAKIFLLNGKLTATSDREITVSGAGEAMIVVNIGTSGSGKDPEAESAIRDISLEEWPKLLKQNIADYAKYYNNMTLELTVEESPLPTDERIEKSRRGRHDDGLPLLFFNYARYLLFASSARGELPANLQGKWCENLSPPWNCDYHHNINLQMNYWLAEPTGMQTACEALFQYIERLVPHAREAASRLYACNGVYFPLQTDPWGRSTPESCGWAVWNGAAPWLAQHLWWHYQFGQDLDFLKKRAYPFLKEVAAFFESFLVEDESGMLQIVPSQSPENCFKESGCNFPISICVSTAMDVELVWDLLNHSIRAAEILEVDVDKREIWKRMLDKLPALQIGSKGQLLEWNGEFTEVDPGHRHISHLFALYPGEQIDPELTPDLFAAAEKSLELRIDNFGGHTGWSRAWIACCFARLGRGGEAFKHLEKLINDFTSISMLDLHPPRIFQIDGNLGGGAAIIEMLFQSYREELCFLPALPGNWAQGKVTGIRARGGFIVDFSWKSGKLVEAKIRSVSTRQCTIINLLGNFEIETDDGAKVKTNRDEARLTFDVVPNIKYYLYLF